jgi:glycolate oxidase FAD binding subunit
VSTTTTPVRFVRELREICGVEHVIEDPGRLEAVRISGVVPAVAVEPASADEVAAVLRFANEHGLSVVPAGGLTQQQTGNKPATIDVLLYTTRLTEVEHYDPGDLTIGVGAGCSVAQLTSMVAKDGLLFAADIAQPERATIGGTLATGLTGPLRHGYGGLRDYCIGVRFVTADGRKGKGGGRVVKNVAGYDMMKLLIGSWGTLAVITSASFKLFPAPRQTRTFIACFATSVEALQFRDTVLRSPLSPICLELASPAAGGVIGTGYNKTCWQVYLRASGSDVVLARYRAELGSAIAREVCGDEEARCWRTLADFPAQQPMRDPQSLLLSLMVPLRDVRRVLDLTQEVAAANGFTLAAVGRVGVGHLLVSLSPAAAEQVANTTYVAAMSALNQNLPRDASLRVLYCPEAVQTETLLFVKTPTDAASMRAVKQALDPKDILNRGRFAL